MSEVTDELRYHEREYASLVHGPLCGKAADEIGRLVKALETIRDLTTDAGCDRLMNIRDLADQTIAAYRSAKP